MLPVCSLPDLAAAADKRPDLEAGAVAFAAVVLQIFHAKHATRANRAERYVSGNAVHFRMNRILDIYFVGGFGTVQVGGVGLGSRCAVWEVLESCQNAIFAPKTTARVRRHPQHAQQKALALSLRSTPP